MVRQRADSRARREINRRQAEHAPRQRNARDEAAGSALHIALHAGHLPGEIQAGAADHAVLRVEEARRMEERVAVHHAIAQELRVFKAGDHGEDALLLAPLEPRLEADEVIHRPRAVLRAELHDGVGLAPGSGIDEADGLHRSERHHHFPARGHHLDGHAALEDLRAVKPVHIGLFGGQQRLIKRLVFLAGHRAVEVIVAAAVAPLPEHLRHIQRFAGDDRRGRVVKIQRLQPRQRRDFLRQLIAGQRPGGDDGVGLRQLVRLAEDDLNQRMAAHGLRHIIRKLFAIHRQRAARRHARRVRRLEDEAAKLAHLLLEQADGVGQLVASERIGANQFGKARAVVRRRKGVGLHFVQGHGHAALGKLPRRLAPRQPRADHNRSFHHSFSSCGAGMRSRQVSFAQT